MDLIKFFAIPAKYKFLGQLVAALVIPLYGGIVLRDVSAFGLYVNFGIFSYPLTVFFIVAAINCVNLIDGLDGLSGGITSIFLLTIGINACDIAFVKNDGNMISGKIYPLIIFSYFFYIITQLTFTRSIINIF